MNENLRNEIISENKFQRKRGLENLIKEIHNEKDYQKCQKVFNDYQVYVLKCFRDESEICRELAIDLMLQIIRNLNLNDYYITYIFPVIVERIGTPEIVEDSEELRLKMMQFMIEIIHIYSKTEYLVPFLNDIIIILVNSLTDKHPKVKQACCECVLETAVALPKHFHMQCENLIKPLIKCFTHQHFRIRLLAIQAVGVVIMHGSYNALENTVTSLAERLFDQIPQVRKAVIEVSAQLLTEYRDRYSYFHKILPLILTGLSDEVLDTRNHAEQLWEKVGLVYQEENEKDLKDELDFLENGQNNRQRPNLGCRVLVQRHCSKICAALCRELTNTWQDDIKIRCGQLLTSLILHTEANFTQHLQDVFPAMFSVCRRNDDGSQSVIHAARLIGVFVPVKTWIKFVSEVFANSVTCGHLRVVKAILTGCDAENLSSICDEVLVLLSQRHICHVRAEDYQNVLMECCQILANCNGFSENDMCIVCLAILGLGKDENVKKIAEELLEKCWITSQDSAQVCRGVLGTLTGDPACWSTVTTDRCILDAVLSHSPSVANLYTAGLLEMLSRCLCHGEDAEARLTTYIALSGAVQSWTDNQCDEMAEFYGRIAKDIVLPNLIWHAGRSREALRTISIQCLCNILESGRYNWIDEITPKLIPLLVCLLEDASRHTRTFSTRCVALLRLPDQESLVQVYQLLLSRLDDEFELARLAALEAIGSVFEKLPQDFDFNIFEPHFEHLVDTLLVHLDDESDELKKILFDCLEIVSRMNPPYVANKLSSVEHIFENKKQYQEFIDKITI